MIRGEASGAPVGSTEAAAGGERDEPEGEHARLDAVRRRVLNVVGHELRTPVTTIRGLAESMASADDVTVRSTLVPAVVRNARRLERLLDDLLVASDVTTALPVAPVEPVAVAPVALEVWDAVCEELGHPGGERLTVDGDAVALMARPALRMLLERVLDNAARYGDAPSTVTVTDEAGRVRIVVDTPGAEIHPEEVALAVEPFFRGEQAVMTAPGLGVGLPVARALARQAGGTLWVEAREGGGLVTVVELAAA